MFGEELIKDEKKAEENCLLGCIEESKLAKGMKSLFGWQTNINQKEAFEIFEEGSKEKENKETKYILFLLGRCHHKGEGTIKDPIKALEIYQKAIKMGNTNAMYNSAIIYEKRDGVQKNLNKAIELYEMAASFGHYRAMNNLAIIYKTGDESFGVKKNFSRAIQLYEQAIQLGSFYFYLFYFIFIYFYYFYLFLFILFILFILKGYVNSLYNLAIIYKSGDEKEGIKKDVKKAIELYEKACEKGDSNSMYNLAIIYKKGEEGVEKDLKRAMELYEKASQQGKAKAMHNLAVIYQRGEKKAGIKKNLIKAIEYYQKASLLDYPASIHNLSIIYKNGDENEGIQKDVKKSIELLERSASLGQLKSMYVLSRIYEHGDQANGIEMDLDKACFFIFKRYISDFDPKYQSKFLNFIDNHQNFVVWKTDYHPFWKKDKSLNRIIVLLLLISKFRKQIPNPFLHNAFLKGITMNVIKFLCHFSVVSEEINDVEEIELQENQTVNEKVKKKDNCSIF